MFYVPLAQNVNYENPLMRRLELASHFVSAIMLVTELAPGAVEPMLTRALAEVDPNLTLTSVRTMQQQVDLSSLRVSNPTLEDLFIKLTGHALRE